jgi:hypothetical protein
MRNHDTLMRALLHQLDDALVKGCTDGVNLHSG